MRKILFVAIGATMLATGADAATLFFTVANSQTFQLDSDPTPDLFGAAASGGITFKNIQVASAASTKSYDVSFYPDSVALGGGLHYQITFQGGPEVVQTPNGPMTFPGVTFGFTGPQLFSGSLAAPHFDVGDYGFTKIAASPTTAAVPEPTTWAMFIGGFGLIGGTMRRRHRATVRFA